MIIDLILVSQSRSDGVVEWNRNEKAFINKIKETPEYEFIVDYCLGESRIKSMITAYTVMKTTDFKREVADNFKATRKTLISIWEQMLKGSDYRYKNSLVKAGPVALAKGNQDIEDLILSFLIKAPWTILKVLAESYDPNIAISKGNVWIITYSTPEAPALIATLIQFQ